MRRPPASLQPSPSPNGFIQTRQTHPLLSGFPLAVMMLGILLVLFALIMTLSADADGAARLSKSIPHVARSLATTPARMSVV
jgi:hypothetical protein